MRKYRNKPVTVDGIKFDSQREANIFAQYKILERVGKISNLEPHPVYKLVVNGIKVGRFTPDMQFLEDRKLRILDVKSPITAKETAFRLRVRLFEALYGLKVETVY